MRPTLTPFLFKCSLMSYIIEYTSDTDGRANDATQTNFARRINRIWRDVHNLIPRTDPGLFIPGMPTEYFTPDAVGTNLPFPAHEDTPANLYPQKFPRQS